MQSLQELCKLEDTLNLTGQIAAVGCYPRKTGGFSDVYEGHYRGKKVAVKVIREFGSDIATLTKRLVRETRNWNKLHHRNVLQLLGFIYGIGPGKLASLVSPWMPLGTATAYLKTQPVSERFRVVTEVADGLSYLHRHDVVHGDLKGDNILIDHDGQSRIADFGLSQLVTEVNHTNITSTVGSIRWMSKELFDHGIEDPCVSFESDIWAYGMTVLELFTSKVPYHQVKNNWAVIPFIHRGEKPAFPGYSCGFTEELWQLCDECWHENPALRPKMRDIAKRVWFLELSFKRTKKRPAESQIVETDDSCSDLETSRLKKSPKLDQFLLPDQLPSPGSPFGSTMSFLPSPPTRTMTMNSNSPRSAGFEPRRMLYSYSDSDNLPSLHTHRHRNFRTISEPAGPRPHLRTRSRDSTMGLGLELNSQVFESEDEYRGALTHTSSAHSSQRSVSSPLRQVTFQSDSHSSFIGGQHDHIHNSFQQSHVEHSHNYASDSYEELGRYNGHYNDHEPQTYFSPANSQGHHPHTPFIYTHYSDFTPVVGHISPLPSPSGTPLRLMTSNPDDPIFPDPSLSGELVSENVVDWQDEDSTLYAVSESMGFTTAPRSMTSPVFSDLTPLLTARSPPLPLGPSSPSIGDFGDFDEMTDDNVSLFGGVHVDERETESVGPESPTLLTPRQTPLIRSMALEDRASPPIMTFG